jgi:integrase
VHLYRNHLRNESAPPKSDEPPILQGVGGTSRSRAATARAHLSDWVRELGVKDPEVSPTHAWRHTFKQRAARNGISENDHDEITGHAPASEGRKYTTPTVEDMAAALQKFPRYPIEASGSNKEGRGDVATPSAPRRPAVEKKKPHAGS